MKNVKELRRVASALINSLMKGEIDNKNAKVVVAGMNTMIASARTQISHYKAIGKKSKINFLITD